MSPENLMNHFIAKVGLMKNYQKYVICFTRRCHQARKLENSYIDLNCDIISDIQVKFLTLFG